MPSPHDLDAEDTQFFTALAAVPGVASVTALRYVLVVQKGRLFGWGGIVGDVEEVVRRRFAPGGSFVRDWKATTR